MTTSPFPRPAFPVAFALSALLASASLPPAVAAPNAIQGATPRQRAELARAFVLRWADEARLAHGLAPAAWSQRLVPLFASAPVRDVRAALAAPDLATAVARLAAAARPPRPANALGDPGVDQVYTPLVPCRLVDTRLTFEGQVPADGSRGLVLSGLPSYRAQGGFDGDCGLRTAAPSAVVLSLAAVQPAAAGYATLYPFGTARPHAASVNYPAGDIRGTLVVVRVAGAGSVADATLYSYARSHFVADVVGYYAPPRATALQCLRSAAWTEQGTGIITALSPSCPEGYVPMAANCSTSPEAALVTAGVDGCQARSAGATPAAVTATAICCRVPGRG